MIIYPSYQQFFDIQKIYELSVRLNYYNMRCCSFEINQQFVDDMSHACFLLQEYAKTFGPLPVLMEQQK